MINLFFIIVLLLHALMISNPFPGPVMLLITISFFLFAFVRSKKNTQSTTTVILQLMCYSIPLSWRNIFGGDYGSLPISWFYILGAILMLHLVILKKPIHLNKADFRVFILSIIVIIFTFIPLINSAYISQALSQFITVQFHNILILIVILKGNFINKEDYNLIQKSYIFAGLLASSGVLIQYILFQQGIIIGDINYLNNRTSFNFLFSDASHSSLYFATTAFLAILYTNNQGDSNHNFNYYLITIITLLGAAATSARTGLIVFFFVFFIYILIGQRGAVKKILFTFFGVLAGLGAIKIFLTIRPQTSLSSAILDSSNRTFGYDIALNLFYEKPIFGYGFGRDYLANLMGTSIPHLSFLQYMLQAGFIYAILIFLIIIFALFRAKKLKLSESWLLIVTLIGTCLVPDIFSTRYITLLMAMIFLYSHYNDKRIIK